MDDFTLEDELAVRTTLARYCRTCDDGDIAGVSALFAPDGVFAVPARNLEARGTAAITACFEESQGPPERRGKHLTLNTVLETGNGRVTAVSDFLFLRPVGAQPVLAMAGRYDDEFVKIDGRWVFARREVQAGR
ncbi:nuclear transport factor 2 family protein [Actinomadura rugatobispora]|uniref:Nuclear transport factor 2 family protein n=1 Tax=Actinomadura rugatobispora TaxID=1994 RepID=A0ABW1AIV9_9ACTN|nr:nuclear transport factor 2 family protein [Actinomadura rugatobispora]